MSAKKTIVVIFLLAIFILFSQKMIFAERSLIYFFAPTCQSCQQVKDVIYYLEVIYPDLQVTEINTFDPEKQLLLERYGDEYQVKEKLRGIVPAVFYGQQALVGFAEINAELEGLLESEQITPKPADISTKGTTEKIIDRFQTFKAGTILVAGLIDGINPCAFSTLIFFISFLVVTKQTGKKILTVGASFTLGIFLSYLFMGWGLSKLFDSFQGVSRLARWIYPLTALLVTGLTVVSFHDSIKVLQKKRAKMSLTLPKSIVKLVNKVIQKMMRQRFLILAAFFVGILLSFLEFMCTGQIYLPTIVYITGVASLQQRALFYLLLYNLAFVLPMVVIFVVAYKTNTSRIVAEYLNTRLIGIKLAATGLFLLLSCYLWVLTFRVF